MVDDIKTQSTKQEDWKTCLLVVNANPSQTTVAVTQTKETMNRQQQSTHVNVHRTYIGHGLASNERNASLSIVKVLQK